jgi:hypothetical protein
VVGESDNIGNPQHPYEEGRSRPGCTTSTAYCNPTTELIGKERERERERKSERGDTVGERSSSLPSTGYRNYDAGGPDIVDDITFYNFTTYVFKYKNNTVRQAAAYSSQDGPNTVRQEKGSFSSFVCITLSSSDRSSSHVHEQ